MRSTTLSLNGEMTLTEFIWPISRLLKRQVYPANESSTCIIVLYLFLVHLQLKTEVAALKNENELLRQAHASNNKIQNDVTESKLYIAAREKVQELEEAFEKLTICNKNETAESSKKIQQLEEALASSTQNQNALDIYEGKVKTLEEALQNITIKASQDLSCEADKLKNVEMKLALCEAELKTALQKISCHLEKQLIDAEVIKEVSANHINCSLLLPNPIPKVRYLQPLGKHIL